MSVIITNGKTSLKFRDSDWIMPVVPPKAKPQKILHSSAGISRVHTISQAPSRVLDVSCLLFGADQGTYSGLDSLMDFWEDGTDGMAKTFMITDADGVAYQARFADNLGSGFFEQIKGSVFQGSFKLLEEFTLPTYDTYKNAADVSINSCHGWWTAYDMDDNGGDLSAWTTLDAVGAAAATDWDDKSGNNYDGVQISASYGRPTWTTSVINGRPVLDFDDGDWLLADGLIVFNNQADYDWSIYAVVESDADATVNTVIGAGHSSGTDVQQFLRRNSTDNWEVYLNDGSAHATEAGGTPDVLPHIISVISTGTSAQIYQDGVALTMTGDVDVGTMTLDSFTIGGLETAGSYGDHWDGEIGEVVVFNVAHSTLQRKRQEYRLSDMWGIDLAIT